MAVTERIPKNAYGLQVIGARLCNELVDALVITDYALRTSAYDQRTAYIESLIHNMTVVTTLCRGLHDYSCKEKHENTISSNGKPVARVVPRHGRIVSNAQYTSLLEDFHILSREIGAWRKSCMTKQMADAIDKGHKDKT